MSKSNDLFGSRCCTWFCVTFVVLGGIIGPIMGGAYAFSPSLANEVSYILIPLIFGVVFIISPLVYFIVYKRRNYSKKVVYFAGWGITSTIALIIGPILNFIVGLNLFFLVMFYLLVIPIITIIFISAIILKFQINKGIKWSRGFKVTKKERSRLQVLLNDTKPQDIKKDEFELLIRKAKKCVEKGKDYFLKNKYELAIEMWKEANSIYEETKIHSDEHSRVEKISNSQFVLLTDIFNCYLQGAKSYISKAKKFEKEKKYENSKEQWNNALRCLNSTNQFKKSNKIKVSGQDVNNNIKDIEYHLKKVEIEQKVENNTENFEIAKKLQSSNITKALNIVNDICINYSGINDYLKTNKELIAYSSKIKKKITEAREFQNKLQASFDELIGLSPITNEIQLDSGDFNSISKKTKKKKRLEEDLKLVIKREYEFIGGKVRFKTSLKNNTGYNITDVNINFNIPEALKWIITDPKYERKGDSVIISKIGKDDKISISLYLEPINCVESSINATISYFDIQNKPIAIPMNPKKISITCPIFFTREEVNLARVKNLHNSMSHCDKKIFPIVKIDKLDSFFIAALSALKTHDIKLISEEFNEEEKTAEAWFYGITKVKKNRVITHISLDGGKRIFLFEVSGDSEEQITTFLAEIGSAIRAKLIDNNILSREDKFWDIDISVLSYVCPYCYSHISSEFVQKYLQGEAFRCKNCHASIPKSEIKKLLIN